MEQFGKGCFDFPQYRRQIDVVENIRPGLVTDFIDLSFNSSAFQ